MAIESERVRVEKEVQRKIGRNLMMFQQVEHMLKFLIANGNISGYLSDIKRKQSTIVNNYTLGQLVRPFLEDTLSGSGGGAEEPIELSEPYIAFSFKVETDAVFYEKRKQNLASLVANRNDLVHHLLQRLDISSIESMMETDRYLDQQREELLPEIKILRSIMETLQDGRKEMAEYLISEEGKKEFKLGWLRQERVVILLGDIAFQMARSDGWTLLSTAGRLLRQHAPEELASLNQRYGFKTLKQLILATEIFEFHELRVLYRLKDGWRLSSITVSENPS